MSRPRKDPTPGVASATFALLAAVPDGCTLRSITHDAPDEYRQVPEVRVEFDIKDPGRLPAALMARVESGTENGLRCNRGTVEFKQSTLAGEVTVAYYYVSEYTGPVWRLEVEVDEGPNLDYKQRRNFGNVYSDDPRFYSTYNSGIYRVRTEAQAHAVREMLESLDAEVTIIKEVLGEK